MGVPSGATMLSSHCREKHRKALSAKPIVLKTDTGRQAEKAKGSGITPVKELGKLAP